METKKQNETQVSLQSIVEFADDNGYRLLVEQNGHEEIDNRDTIDGLLANGLICICKRIGCGIDYRHAKSIGGQFDFWLVS